MLASPKAFSNTDNPRRTLPNMIYGITTDNGYDSIELPNAIKALSRKVCTRVVFDENIPPQDYIIGVNAIYSVSCVMGLVVDSSTLSRYTVPQYQARFNEYFDVLVDKVDIWEIGNEVNGEWTGRTADVVSKITRAFNLARQRNLRTAMTLYYNTPCQGASDREMFRWSEENLSEQLKMGLDYVFISYYDDDCPGSEQNWNEVFNHLVKIFPNSKVGFGELGTTAIDRKKYLIKKYYQLSLPSKISTPNFVGGYFYWYFHQDMVPRSKELWTFFDSILQTLPNSNK
jgi:hypothetical protein